MKRAYNTKKIAILQVADTGPLESLVIMLNSVDYVCCTPTELLKQKLRTIGCDTVLDIQGLVDNWGYDKPMKLPLADVEAMQTADLFVDIKAHRNGPKVWKWYPNLREKTLWYRINGGEPEITQHGDEINLECPILTPNLWYRDAEKPWSDKAYSCWPPFHRFLDYYDKFGRTKNFADPICLIHNVEGWGYGELIGKVRDLGVKCYGCASPDGLIVHSKVPSVLSTALCSVHLKGSDSPGYALYEAIAAGCPLIVSRSLIWRNRMEELFQPGVTCLAFDQASHDPCDVAACEKEIVEGIERLRDPEENKRIGLAARDKLKTLMWSDDQQENVESLREFINRVIG